MNDQSQDHMILTDIIPDVDSIRRRLAIVLTEACLLRSQLRLSRKLQLEQDRLLRQKLRGDL